ncbi:MAG: hypothetical protein VX325_03990 [Bacteroidota bacterium]|nr:hypothetical protein [Bacteroidota bacterium]
MIFNKIFQTLLLLVFFLLNISCDLFDSSKISNKEIEAASKWSKKDQPPTFPECESLSFESQIDCMSDILSTYITDYVYSSAMIANGNIDEEIVLVIKIDKEGFFSLSEIQNSNEVIQVLPDIESLLRDAVISLPQALPATKTNVGTFVETQLTLPIQIIALASE